MAFTPSTKVFTQTIQQVLDQASPNLVADALAQVDLGTMLDPVKVTFALTTPTATLNITTVPAAQITVNAGLKGKTLTAAGGLPPIHTVRTLRNGAGGTLAAGPAIVTDDGGTATAIGTGSVHVVLLSLDGTTLTFQAAVANVVLEYIPRANVADFSAKFASDVKS
jgi:hypothetical protein